MSETLSSTKSEILNTLFRKYGLIYDPNDKESKDNDVYIHKHYTIITRTGIQKIERAANIKCEFTPLAVGENYCYLSVIGTASDGTTYQTLSSANTETCKTSGYYPEIAEKRGRSRVILTLAGLYEQGVFGQDEAEDFDRDKVKTVTYKGK